MTIEEQFTEIILKTKSDHFLAFLQSLTPEQKKSLSGAIKKFNKEYSEYGELGGGRYGHIKGSDKQRNMLLLASFVCLNRADYERSGSPIWFLLQDTCKATLDWYVPDWFNSYVNDSARLDFFSVDYDWIMQLTEKGVLIPSKELIVKSMPGMIFELKDKTYHYVPENLLKWPVTLQEHIWYLFELESNLHYSDRFLYFGKELSKDKIGWKQAFPHFMEEGKLDRQRLLRESLLASSKNFNKVLSGWFAQLFADFQPTKVELLHLQKELFSVLSSQHSKPVNMALDGIKKIMGEKTFDIHGFLDAVPVLLSSDVKAVVNSTLSILEKIAKKNPEHQSTIASLTCSAFIHADDDLQAKAAKLILGNHSAGDETILHALQPYLATMLSSARRILEPITSSANAVTRAGPVNIGTLNSGTGNSLVEPIPIPPIGTVDDLVFLASQAFDNNQPWHISVFPAALADWQKEIVPHHIAKFEPALQRALKMMKAGANTQQGQLDHMLAVFFIDVCIHWVRSYPAEAKVLDNLFEKHKQVDGNEVKRWTNIGENDSYLVSWESYNKLSIYVPYQQLLVAALEKIVFKDPLPMLSTPTYKAGWIDPLVLTERVVQYAAANTLPSDMDLQAAIARCRLHDTAKAIALAEKKLNGEYLNLLLFLFDKHTEPHPPFGFPPAWMTASLTKTEKRQYKAFSSFPWYKQDFRWHTGQHEWESVDEEYESGEYDYNAQKRVAVMRRRKIMRVFTDKVAPKQSGFKKFLSKIGGSPKEQELLTIYDHLHLKTQWISAEHNDIHRILLLAPNHPEPLLGDALNQCLHYPRFWSETDKRFIISILQALHEIWDGFADMAHVFIGTCMLSSDKTVANLAAEIWINAVTTDKINSAKIGEVIGKHERIEFAPLKRFTDLVMGQMFRVSEKHNKELLVMVEGALKELPEKPVTNLKKLLEVYGELLVMNVAKVNDKILIEKLKEWKSIAVKLPIVI